MHMFIIYSSYYFILHFCKCIDLVNTHKWQGLESRRPEAHVPIKSLFPRIGQIKIWPASYVGYVSLPLFFLGARPQPDQTESFCCNISSPFFVARWCGTLTDGLKLWKTLAMCCVCICFKKESDQNEVHRNRWAGKAFSVNITTKVLTALADVIKDTGLCVQAAPQVYRC